MIKITKIVEEDEDGDDEDDNIQILQDELQMKQFFMDENDVINQKSIGNSIKQNEKQSDQKEQSSSLINSSSQGNLQNETAKRQSILIKQSTTKIIIKNNEEIQKISRASICNENNKVPIQPQRSLTNNLLQFRKNQINTQNISFERPKTANDYHENKLNDEKINQSPNYRISHRKLPKETFLASRSLSPTENGNSSSSLSQNSAQFDQTKNQINGGRQLMNLENDGQHNKEVIVQQEKEKQFIQDIDKKIHNSIQNIDITQKAIKTAPNFYKSDQKEISNIFQESFKIKKHEAILKTNQFSGERCNSLSPPKKPNSRHLPHRIVELGDHNNNILTKKWQHPKSLERIKEWKQIEKQNSPASKIEVIYQKANKIIDKKHERPDLIIKTDDVQFNDKYFSILKCSNQVKSPIEIIDSEYIFCNLYALTYNAYFIPISKRQLPFNIELILYSGEIEMYVSKTEEPNINHNDFNLTKFDIPIKIKYQKDEVKDRVYINIFSKQQSGFQFRIISSQNDPSNIPSKSNNNQQQNNQKQQKIDPKQKNEKKYKSQDHYKKQLILDQARYNENKFKKTKEKEIYVVDVQKEEKDKIEFYLENRIKDFGNFRNIVEDNIKEVKKSSPKERQEHTEKVKNDKQVKIVRAQYNKNISDFKEINKEILKIQYKFERKDQLIDADKRLYNEIRLLKQLFQYRWLQILVLIQIIKVFHAKMKAHRVKISRNINLTSPIMCLNNLISNYLSNKLGNNKYERTYTRVYFLLKARVKAFKPLMVQSAAQVAGEFLQQKIKLMIIQSKMMIYYNHILMIQRSYRKLQQLRDKMNEVNLVNWELAIKIMLEDEQKFFDKSWIAKPVLIDFKKRLDKNKMKVLTHHVKQIQAQFFSRLKQYKEKLKKLPNSHQIAYMFCSKAFHTYFVKQYKKTIEESYNTPITKRTNEYYIETLKFMVKHNVYQLVNNPITAYEKEKQKLLEAQKKKNIEALRQKELLLQKQREEEFMQQKIQKSVKKNTNAQEEQSVSSSSSLDSNGEPKKQSDNPSNLKKSRVSTATKRHTQKKSTVVENTPMSFQDYLQQEEMQQEESKALKKLKNKQDLQNHDLSSPSKLMEERIKKKIAQKNMNQSFNSITNIEDSILENQDTPRSNRMSKYRPKRDSILITEGAQFNDDSPPVSIFFKKDKSSHKIPKKDGNLLSESMVFHDKKKEKNKSPKKTVRINQENEENNIGQENDGDNQNEEDDDFEYEDAENYHEDVDNYLSKHHPMRNNNKKPSIKINKQSLQRKLSSSSKMDDESTPRTMKSPNNDDWSDNEDSSFSSKKKLTSEQVELKIQKSSESKKSKFQNNQNNMDNSSNESSLSSSSLNQLSQSNISTVNGCKDISVSTNNQMFIKIQEQTPTSQIHSLAATPSRAAKLKPKKKKSKKKKQANVEEGKLEEIVEGDEATQTFWSNFIHYPIFQSYPNITEMKELVIKLYKKL